ncbi:MAG: dockerin type I domain-containing protein [Patescibacteria group bacterium]
MLFLFRTQWSLVGAARCVLILLAVALWLASVGTAAAANITEFSNTISDSGPGELSNQTITFTLNVDVGPGSTIEVTPPPGFSIPTSTTFLPRNVELRVDGAVRPSAATPAPGTDGVTITTGSPGLIQYTLAPDFSIDSGSQLELRIGNHTNASVPTIVSYSTSTGTTTSPGDDEPIRNAEQLGQHNFQLEVYDGSRVAEARPVVFLLAKVRTPGVDTTEEIPPERFNGAPTSSVGGTTPNVEISLETNEFSFCRYDTASGTPYTSMTNTFNNTGIIFHSTVVPVTPGTVARFYVRCIDDEGNFNTDDYLIEFAVQDTPTGEANEEGVTSGDGTGTGDDGTGEGDGAGGTTGSADGQAPEIGSSAGGGGSGGGSGGGGGGGSGSRGGGGFEDSDGPYESGDGRVIINGFAFPDASVTVLVDGEIAERASADSTGDFSVTVDEIARGTYTFGVYATGPDDTKSSTFSTSFSVSGARASQLSNINIPPSITIDPDPVDPGETLSVSGYALPNAEIEIENSQLDAPNANTLTTTSDDDGFWSLALDTDSFNRGTYQIRARAEQADGEQTNFSDYTFYGVGEEAATPGGASDLNVDGSVNLTDFSILLFWWNTDGGDSDPAADINQDGSVNLTDFSILLFNWTG